MFTILDPEDLSAKEDDCTSHEALQQVDEDDKGYASLFVQGVAIFQTLDIAPTTNIDHNISLYKGEGHTCM